MPHGYIIAGCRCQSFRCHWYAIAIDIADWLAFSHKMSLLGYLGHITMATDAFRLLMIGWPLLIAIAVAGHCTWTLLATMLATIHMAIERYCHIYFRHFHNNGCHWWYWPLILQPRSQDEAARPCQLASWYYYSFVYWWWLIQPQHLCCMMSLPVRIVISHTLPPLCRFSLLQYWPLRFSSSPLAFHLIISH